MQEVEGQGSQASCLCGGSLSAAPLTEKVDPEDPECLLVILLHSPSLPAS